MSRSHADIMGEQQIYLPCKTDLQQLLLLSFTMYLWLHSKYEQFICRNTNLAFGKFLVQKPAVQELLRLKKLLTFVII